MATAVTPIWSVPPMRTLRQIRRISVEGKLEADGEEKQHDAHFGEHFDVILRLDDADARRPRDRAGDDERDDRRNADAAQDEDEDQGDRVRQHQFGQGSVHGHDSV